jgi:hypothetical protein
MAHQDSHNVDNNLDQPKRFEDLKVLMTFQQWIEVQVEEAVAQGKADSLDAFLVFLKTNFDGLELEGFQQNMAEDLLGFDEPIHFDFLEL